MYVHAAIQDGESTENLNFRGPNKSCLWRNCQQSLWCIEMLREKEWGPK